MATDRKQAFETIGAQAWRIRDMIGNSMLFARPPQPHKEHVNLVEVVQQTLSTVRQNCLGRWCRAFNLPQLPTRSMSLQIAVK